MAPDRSQMYLRWVRAQARALRRGWQPPRTLEQWQQRRRELRERIFEAVGRGLEKDACDLAPRSFGVLRRDGYRIEKLAIQTRPGVWMTANAYVPEAAAERPVPAVLNVHGHFSEGKLARVPHYRSLGLVRQGYFVLMVDAFGAGERADDPLRPVYHGALRGAACWTIGYPLLALQVYDNMRAVDYLLTRPEVDGQRIAVTGASGGGNQSMNVGAIDERISVVVPVCSVGNYQAYLGVACCVGEVLPGALTFCEEGELLGLVAPRPLLVMNASHDGPQFSIIEAAKSIAIAREIYRLYGCQQRLRHAVFEDRHGYSRQMRETLYGWLNRWLRGAESDDPVAEPDYTEEPKEALRCFPDGKRFAGFLTQSQFVAGKWRELLQRRQEPDHKEAWEAEKLVLTTRLEKVLNWQRPAAASVRELVGATPQSNGDCASQQLEIVPEPGIVLRARFLTKRPGRERPAIIVVDPDARRTNAQDPLVRRLLHDGAHLLLLELRATGSMAVPRDRIRDAVDHNSVEWSVWIGRPLLGLWAIDMVAAIDVLLRRSDVARQGVAVVGAGAGGLAAIVAAALDERISAVATLGMLASFSSEANPSNHRMAYFVPHLYRVGDIPTLAALVAPRPLILAGPRKLDGTPLTRREAADYFQFTSRVYGYYGAAREIRLLDDQGGVEPISRALVGL